MESEFPEVTLLTSPFLESPAGSFLPKSSSVPKLGSSFTCLLLTHTNPTHINKLQEMCLPLCFALLWKQLVMFVLYSSEIVNHMCPQ